MPERKRQSSSKAVGGHQLVQRSLWSEVAVWSGQDRREDERQLAVNAYPEGGELVRIGPPPRWWGELSPPSRESRAQRFSDGVDEGEWVRGDTGDGLNADAFADWNGKCPRPKSKRKSLDWCIGEFKAIYSPRVLAEE